MFAALGDETRLAIVLRLCAAGPLSITRLTDGAGVSRQGVTKHLHVLESAGVVQGSRQGREQLWELRPRALEAARRHLEVISRQWDNRLDRLRAFVENDSPDRS